MCPSPEMIPYYESWCFSLCGCVLHHICIWWPHVFNVLLHWLRAGLLEACALWALTPLEGALLSTRVSRQLWFLHHLFIVTWLLQPGSDRILWTLRSQRSLFFLANLPGSINFIELIDFYHEWVNDVLWKLLRIFMWLQETETAPSPPPTFAYLKAEFFRLFISNHNRCFASETALRHQIERSWGYRLDSHIIGWNTVVFIMQRVGIDILF